MKISKLALIAALAMGTAANASTFLGVTLDTTQTEDETAVAIRSTSANFQDAYRAAVDTGVADATINSTSGVADAAGDLLGYAGNTEARVTALNTALGNAGTAEARITAIRAKITGAPAASLDADVDAVNTALGTLPDGLGAAANNSATKIANALARAREHLTNNNVAARGQGDPGAFADVEALIAFIEALPQV